jgi:UDP-N-acetylglucosamine transferase subunit ALG13
LFFRFIDRISKLKLFYKQISIPAAKNLKITMAKAVGENLLRKSRILVAPLDWGLGHATRCIPVVKELLARDCDVWLAGEGLQEALLRAEFPQLPFLPLTGYRVAYSNSGSGLLWKMLRQLPKITSAIRNEHAWLRKMVTTHKIDGVISDNRFGLYHASVPSVFITHQLNIRTGLGKRSEKVIRQWNYKQINRFTECWIPDVEGETNLAGELSHPLVRPTSVTKYIGLLSRFETNANTALTKDNLIEKAHLLFILSGPEPQRSILENKIVNEVSHYAGTSVIVRGLPTSFSVIPSTGMIKFYNHLPAIDLSEEIKKADWVISRSGYSTIMDLVKLGKKSILIPTPGQTEQEYLAFHLREKHIAFTVDQNKFFLEAIIEEASKFNYKVTSVPAESQLKRVLQDFVSKLI